MEREEERDGKERELQRGRGEGEILKGDVMVGEENTKRLKQREKER